MPSELLDHARLQLLKPGKYARVFEPVWGDVLTANPTASGRFSLKASMPHGATGAAGWYISGTLRGALWESVLRDVDPDNARGVSLDSAQLARTSVQWVQLREPLQVLRLEPTQRRHVISRSSQARDERLEYFCHTPLYEMTHTAAGLLQLQFGAQVPPLPLPGISWRSKQSTNDVVYVLYQPPLDTTLWQPVGKPIKLDSKKGLNLLRTTLAAEDMTWLNDPAGGAAMPPPGAV